MQPERAQPARQRSPRTTVRTDGHALYPAHTRQPHTARRPRHVHPPLSSLCSSRTSLIVLAAWAHHRAFEPPVRYSARAHLVGAVFDLLHDELDGLGVLSSCNVLVEAHLRVLVEDRVVVLRPLLGRLCLKHLLELVLLLASSLL